jgi:hypothetical protein
MDPGLGLDVQRGETFIAPVENRSPVRPASSLVAVPATVSRLLMMTIMTMMTVIIILIIIIK